jgi:hypothetical protein
MFDDKASKQNKPYNASNRKEKGVKGANNYGIILG